MVQFPMLERYKIPIQTNSIKAGFHRQSEPTTSIDQFDRQRHSKEREQLAALTLELSAEIEATVTTRCVI